MKVTCHDHRKSMILLGLQLRLKEGVADPKERKKIENKIKALEKELGMD